MDNLQVYGMNLRALLEAECQSLTAAGLCMKLLQVSHAP